MAELVGKPAELVRPGEALTVRIGAENFNVDYLDFFDSRLHPYGHESRSRQVAETQISRLTHGQTLSAKHSNPSGVKAERDPQLLVTYAIAKALEAIDGSVHLSGGKPVREKPRFRIPAKERSSGMVITPITKDGQRLVTERGQDGNTHRLLIHWVPEEQAQKWIEAERQKIRANSR